MTTAPSPAPAPTVAPGPGGPTTDEKKAAAGMVAAGFALGGPVGGVVMALAIGIEQAFGKSGWDQPGWLGGPGKTPLTPEEIQQRHDEAVQRAREYVEEARRQAKERAAALKEHRKATKEWIENGKQGPKPERPESRNPADFLGDLWGASKSWYTLIDDKFAKGNEKVTGTYPAIADFFRNLWRFVSGFVEGVSSLGDGYREYKQYQKDLEQDPEPERPAEPDPKPLPGGGEPEALPQSEPQPEPGPQPEPDREPVKVDATIPPPPPPVTPEPVTAGPEPQQIDPRPIGSGEGTAEGEPMPTDSNAALPSGQTEGHVGPQGETNLDLLYQAFAPAAPVLASVSEQVDELKKHALAVAARVARISALCGVNGAPVVVYQMINEARQLSDIVTKGLVDIDVHNEVARELTDEALIGLLPASDDLNTTRTEQASGDIYNRAGH